MLLAPEFLDLDLPVYSADTEVVSRSDMHLAKLAPTFVRSICVDVPGQLMTLAEILKKTDEELEIVADFCDAEVVQHQWGLVPDNGRCPAIRGMPDGHRLVAEVNTIVRTSNLSGSEQEAIRDRTNEYSRLRGLRLYDVKPAQLMRGNESAHVIGSSVLSAITGQQREIEPRLWWVDIEPRLYRH